MTGLADVSVDPGAQDLLTYFNGAESNFAFRKSEFQNIEDQPACEAAETSRRVVAGAARTKCWAVSAGSSSTSYSVSEPSTAVPTQLRLTTKSEVQNTLLGFQLGGRREYGVTDKFSFVLAGKLGVFNNGITHRQSIRDSNDVLAYRHGLRCR